MTREEIAVLRDKYVLNYGNAYAANVHGDCRDTVIAMATVIDVLREDLKHLESTLLEARQKSDTGPQTIPDGILAPTTKDVWRDLNNLGIDDLREIQGWNMDFMGRILLLINGRYADSGWRGAESPMLSILKKMMRARGIPIGDSMPTISHGTNPAMQSMPMAEHSMSKATVFRILGDMGAPSITAIKAYGFLNDDELYFKVFDEWKSSYLYKTDENICEPLLRTMRDIAHAEGHTIPEERVFLLRPSLGDLS